MNENTLRKLEFDRIREMLAKHASTTRGKELALDLYPGTDTRTIIQVQAETTQARRILQVRPEVPLGGIRDLRGVLKQARLGGVLEPHQLLDVADTLVGGRRLKGFLLGLEGTAPLLAARAVGIREFPFLEEEIKRCIGEEGEVKDDASPELARLRQRMRTLKNRIREKLDALTRSPELRRYLQDPIVTLRRDRYVVPVKEEYQDRVPGVVHDQSASGATLFIEPMPVVRLGNELRAVESRERKEVERILENLSREVANQEKALAETLKILAELDLIFARGSLSLALSAVEPEFNDEGWIDIKKGRHPLLGGVAVPVDIYLGRDFSTMVITGPNTGGKTVTLKMVGLLVLMAQSGLHVPADPGTKLAVFDSVFADIGDEQSIEQSLSTFSSHLKNIIQIINNLTERSLVLLDELGAGTDPAEGSALGMAILDYLLERGARTIATTHSSELKTYAYQRDRVENASVEFDPKTLRPTFRLLIGLPGRSNAFQIASRLGLPEGIVSKARACMGEDRLQVDALIEEIETNRRRAEQERKEAERDREVMVRLKRDQEERLRSLEEKRRQILQEAYEEARAIVQKARQESEEILAELRKLRAQQEAREAERALQAARTKWKARLEQVEEGMEELAPNREEPVPRDLKPGETVFILSLMDTGLVLEGPKEDGRVLVQAGIMKVDVHLRELRRVKGTSEERSKKSAGVTSLTRLKKLKAQHVAPEVHLRGLTVDEALAKAEKFLDDACLAGLKEVKVIHGKGAGILRREVVKFLDAHPLVVSYRPGEQNEGGEGVTIVRLD